MDPWKEITAVAKEMGVDLLLISTHGPSGFEYLIHGSGDLPMTIHKITH
jgi:nucleotide-binding universal stress UspA family protein